MWRRRRQGRAWKRSFTFSIGTTAREVRRRGGVSAGEGRCHRGCAASGSGRRGFSIRVGGVARADGGRGHDKAREGVRESFVLANVGISDRSVANERQ